MSSALTEHFGKYIDLGYGVIGNNLNLSVFRGFSSLDQLALVSGPDVYDEYMNNTGTQRELDRTHAKQCKVYSSESTKADPSIDPRSFPELILNARDGSVLEFYGLNEEVLDNLFDSSVKNSMKSSNVVGIRIKTEELEFPTPQSDPQISRVDGNHRLSGVDIDDVLINGFDSSVVVPFALYIGLTTDQEVKIFADINGKHKGMDVTHLMNIQVKLGGENLKFDEKNRHVWLASKLAESNMAFGGMIFSGGAKKGAKQLLGAVPPLKLNSLASTVKLQLANAKSLMADFSDNPDALLLLLNNYWTAVRNVFAIEWNDKANYILLQSIGLSGFAQLGGELFDRLFSESSEMKVADFEKVLLGVQGRVDLSRSSDQWQGVAGAGGGNKVAEVLIRNASASSATKAAILAQVKTFDPGAQLD